MENVKPVKSKYSHCPACKIEFQKPDGLREPSIRAMWNMCGEILGFIYKCDRCSYEWFESEYTGSKS